MFGNTYYHQTLRRIVACFGTIFNDINVVRVDSATNEKQRMKVPISYGPKDRYLVRLQDDPDLNRQVDIVLPRIAFNIVTFSYDGNRKLRTMGRNHKAIPGDNTRKLREFNPVPYNIGMDLNIISKSIDDGNQIVEQILPFFTPDYTVTVMLVPELELKHDIPIVLNSVNLEDNYDDEWKTRRNVIWTLNFTVKAYFYGPVKTDPLITKTQEDYLVPNGDVNDKAVRDATPRIFRVTTVPDPLNADPESDFGFTETFEQFQDGKKYNPVTGQDEDV